MPTLLTYDISSQHVAFKKALLNLGYTDQIPGSPSPANLPNTTLSHSTRTTLQALNDAKTLANQLKTTLERCVAVSYGDWNGLIGEPHN